MISVYYSYITKINKFQFAFQIWLDIQHHKVCNIRVEKIISLLDLKSTNLKNLKDTIKDTLDLLKKKKIIHNYSKDKSDGYKIW